MYCKNCGNLLKEGESFCSNCGTSVYSQELKNNSTIQDNDSQEKKKNVGFWIGLFSIELALFIFITIIFGFSIFNKTVDNVQNDFVDILEHSNYNLEDLTKNYNYYRNINKYIIGTKEGIKFDYITCLDSDSAYSIYLELKEKSYNSKVGIYSNYYVNYSDNNEYTLIDDEMFYKVSRKGNTVLFSKGIKKNVVKASKVFEKLGYSNSSLGTNVILYLLFIILVIIAINVFAWWKIFVKANKKGWYSLIPLYNSYCMCEIVFGKGWYFLLMFIPFVNFVIVIMLFYKLPKKFGKSTAFSILNIFFSFFILQIIALDDSKYVNN